MNLALPALGLALIAWMLTRSSQGGGNPQLGGGLVRTVSVPPIGVPHGSAFFVVVLDTTALTSAAQIGRALEAEGWTPTGAFEQRGMLRPGNPFSAQGMQWLLPVTRAGADIVITALPVSLGTGLWIIDGGTDIPKSI